MKRWMTILFAVACAGCAKFPGVGLAGSTRLAFSFDVQSAVRTGAEPGNNGIPYVYLVALRFSDQDNPIDGGPIPVVAPPWGNGFVAGRATHFVLWDPTAATAYTVQKFVDPAVLDSWFPIGTPILTTPVTVGSRRIGFELDLAQLFPLQAERDALRSMQVNIMTMDRVPQSGSSKLWDALGDSTQSTSINDYLLIPLRTSALYNNSRSGNLEPTGDVSDPQLDISDWSVEVKLQ